MSKHIHKLALAVVLLATAVHTACACPACKDSFGSASSNANAGEAYSWSILFMLGVPLTILTVAIVAVGKRIKQNPNSRPLV
jgi:hypothetical protein